MIPKHRKNEMKCRIKIIKLNYFEIRKCFLILSCEVHNERVDMLQEAAIQKQNSFLSTSSLSEVRSSSVMYVFV